MPAFELENLPYQQDAVRAVVDVFEGSERRATHELAGNRCTLAWAQLSSNLQAVAQRHRISEERLNLTPPQQGQALDVCVEMETGTGKTLVYLRTLYRLHTAYGWNKFIIVVPTVAIRAGVMGTLLDLTTSALAKKLWKTSKAAINLTFPNFPALTRNLT